MLYGYMGKVLDVNLSDNKIDSYSLPEKTLELYVGGKGLGARMLYDLIPAGTDPLGPDNVLIVTTSALTGTGAPSSNRFNINTKSPLTGAIVDSNCGGNFGVHLKRAGYDALIVRGKAKEPVYLDVSDEGVNIKSAQELWGMDTEQTQENIPGKKGKMVIGPAGENLVKYACIVSEERVAGRAGVGTVMGSKNLKAVSAGGNQKPQVYDEKLFKEACKEWRDVLRSHPSTSQELPQYGTAVFVNRTSETHTLPTRNFQYGQFKDADKISGETLADEYLVKNIGCYGCPMQCGRQVKVDNKPVKGPEYETLGMLGSNLLISDLQAINEWNRQADLLGMDTISLGNTLGFAMEAGEKGLLKTDLKFGKSSNISKAIENIAYRKDLGEDMAEGVAYMAEKYGGKEFAIHSKGLELAAYEPRSAVGHGMGYAVANRGGCHLGAGYVVFLEANGPITTDPYTTKGKPGLAVFNQTVLEAISTLGSCNFTNYAVFPELLIKMYNRSRLFSNVVSKVLTFGGNTMGKFMYAPKGGLLPKPVFHHAFPHIKAYTHCTGKEMTPVDFLVLGQRVFNMCRLFNVREGFSKKEDTLPERLTRDLQRDEEPRSRVKLDEMLPEFYRLRGWDKNGIPTDHTLRKLGIEK